MADDLIGINEHHLPVLCIYISRSPRNLHNPIASQKSPGHDPSLSFSARVENQERKKEIGRGGEGDDGEREKEAEAEADAS